MKSSRAPLAFALAIACTLILGCNALEAIANGMARAQAQNDLAWFRGTTMAVAVLVGLTLVARIVAGFVPRSGRIFIVVVAGCSVIPILAACASAVERPPSAFPYETAFIGALILNTWLALDAVAVGSSRPHLRVSLFVVAVATAGVIVATYFPQARGPVIDAVAPGHWMGCVRFAHGGWTCWGLSTKPKTRPVDLPDGPKAIVGSDVCSLADGRISCLERTLDVSGRVTAVAAGGRGLAVVADGRLLEIDSSGRTVSGFDECSDRRIGPAFSIAVRSGQQTMKDQGCVLRPDKTVSCWASGRFDEHELAKLALDPLAEQRQVSVWVECPMFVKLRSRDVRAIVAGSDHFVALTDDGTALTWGSNKTGQLGRPTPGSSDDEAPRAIPGLRFAEVTASGSSSCGRTFDGAVFCWGEMNGNETGKNAEASNPERVSGLPHADQLFFSGSCACTLSSGQLWCWGGCGRPFRDVEHLREIAGETPYLSFSTPRQIKL